MAFTTTMSTGPMINIVRTIIKGIIMIFYSMNPRVMTGDVTNDDHHHNKGNAHGKDHGKDHKKSGHHAHHTKDNHKKKPRHVPAVRSQ